MARLPAIPVDRAAAVRAAVLLAVAAWSYLPTVAGLVRVWGTDPNYSHGFLIPLLAAGLLWHRLASGPLPALRPDLWLGAGALAVAAAARAVGAYYYVTPLDHLSVLVTLAGLCLLVGGRGWLGRVWPALALLVFTLPIPAVIGGSQVVAGLQQVATRASTFALQTLGVVAYREGNIILLSGAELGIVEACSGLRMLMVFCALATVTAVLVPVGWVRKGLILLSAVPLAIACNVIRITVAGLASQSLGSDTGHFIFHDLAGWLMVPLAFVLLGGELYLLSKLFRPRAGAAPARAEPAGRGAVAGAVVHAGGMA